MALRVSAMVARCRELNCAASIEGEREHRSDGRGLRSVADARALPERETRGLYVPRSIYQMLPTVIAGNTLFSV